MTALWAEKSTVKLSELARKTRIVLLPVGSTEQHGPHLPLGTDHIIAWELCKEVANKIDAVVLPLLPYGYSDDHLPMMGTVSLKPSTLMKIIRDIAVGVSIYGFKHLVIVSGHAGHIYHLFALTQWLNTSLNLRGMTVHNISPYLIVSMETLSTILSEEIFIHAEELETSLMLFLRPDLVDMSKAVRELPDFIPRGMTTANFNEAIRILTTSRFLGRDFKTGVCGDATLATKEKGEKLFKLFVNALAEEIKRVTASTELL
ncbi:MAG: creatininase family protein [Nitrososphaerota archaeon]